MKIKLIFEISNYGLSMYKEMWIYCNSTYLLHDYFADQLHQLTFYFVRLVARYAEAFPVVEVLNSPRRAALLKGLSDFLILHWLLESLKFLYWFVPM